MKKQSAYIALWLALIAGMTLPLQTLPAQDMQPPPSPKDVPGVDDADLPPWTQPTPRKSRTHYGTMSGWDLYAGSVYANTSPIWVQAEGLLWWIEGNPVPALVTTSPNGTPRELAGVLGRRARAPCSGTSKWMMRSEADFAPHWACDWGIGSTT